MRLPLAAILLFSAAASAGDGQVFSGAQLNLHFGPWSVGPRAPLPRFHRFQPQPFFYWYVIPYAVPVATPAPAPAPQVVVFEHAPAVEPAPPQVIIVQVPREEPAPIPAAPALVPAPATPVTAVPLPPRVPGPDVYQWTDADGVTHYSTRVPAAARGKAKKLPTLK